MSSNNNCIAQYDCDKLPWYKRDGLMTYIDKLKCDRFLENPNQHSQQTRIINFDIILKEARGEKISSKDLKAYQTVYHNRVKKYSKREQDNFFICCL